jgi:AcrR family transcriptional regulator
MPVSGQKTRAVRKQPIVAQVRDRRVTRTRRALHRALFSLLEEGPYETLTVLDICERADIGRSAFYEHFAGKDDLFRVGFERLEEELSEALENRQGLDVAGDGRIIALTLFRHAAGHARLYRALARDHARRIADITIANILTPYLLDVLATANDVPKGVRDLRLATILGALLAALHWWLDRGARLEVDTVVDEVTSTILASPAEDR